MAKDDQTYPKNWAGQNTPVSGVVNAVGSFLGGGSGETPPFVRNRLGAGGAPVGGPVSQKTSTAPVGGGTGALPGMLTPSRTGNTANEPNGARANNGSNATARTGWGILGGSGWGGQARTAALSNNPETTGMANSVTNASGGTTTRVRPGEQMPVTKRNQLLAQPGARAVPGGIATTNASGGTTTRVLNLDAYTRGNTNVSGNQTIRTQAQLSNLPVTKHNQARADTAAYSQTPESKVADPHNWAGIARDLGNAGAKPWLSHATGARPSSNAMAYVRANPLQAAAPALKRANVNAPGATRAAASAGTALAGARGSGTATIRPVVRTRAQQRALPVTANNQRIRAAAGTNSRSTGTGTSSGRSRGGRGRNQPV